jgi:predicted component of type VI protein secretion system
VLRLDVVERVCRITTAMVGAEYGYSVGILLHPFECHMFGVGDAGFGRTGMLCSVGKGGTTAS